MSWIRILHGASILVLVIIVSSKGINHAIGKPVIASSYKDATDQSPDKLVDGCYDRAKDVSKCCFASEVEQYPWISLDLLANIKISKILVYGVLCPGRLLYLQCPQSFPLWIMLSNDSSDLTYDNETQFTKYSLGIDMYEEGILNVIFTEPVHSRYVGMKKFNEGAVDSMVVCEIEIFGQCVDPYSSEDCMHTCHCLIGTCDGADGRCMSECEDGWFGDRCDTPCPTGYYGRNCDSTCNTCANNACNATNGYCVEGCPSGRKGEMCSESCSPGTWGHGCTQTCRRCLTVCDGQTGNCDSCKPGWKGRSCRKKCRTGYYGYECAKTCNEHCLSNCNHETGKCKGGCEQGWKGERCEYQCQDIDGDTNSCVIRCPPCGNGTCDTSTGVCSEPCDAGFTGDDCDEPCPDFSYGVNCVHRCGYCFDLTPCYKVDGECLNGCQPGYTGRRCKELQQSRDTQTSLSSSQILIIVVIPIASCLIILLTVFAVVFSRKAHKESKSGKTSGHNIIKESASSKQPEDIYSVY